MDRNYEQVLTFLTVPILNCHTNKKLPQDTWDNLVQQWSKKIRVYEKDINIQFFTSFLQAGAKYELKVELYLPSLWSNGEIGMIQQSFVALAQDILNIRQEDIFLMTQVIQSGHVIDGGKLEEW